MTKTLNQALAAVREWHGKHADRPKLRLSDLSFGCRVMFAGSVAIVDAMTQNNNDPHIIHVRFACDDRRTTFPVTIDQLEPFSAAVADENVVH